MGFFDKLLRKLPRGSRGNLQTSVPSVGSPMATGPEPRAKPMTEKLQVGMTMQELVQLLGQPYGTNPGSEVLRGVVGISSESEIRDQLSRTLYSMWRRPEGDYLLVLVDNRLAKIYSAPGYVEPPPGPPVKAKGAGRWDICAKCGTTLEDRVKRWRTLPRPGVVRIGDEGGLFLWCEHCQMAICGACSVDLGMSCGCPFCEKEMKEFGTEKVKALLLQKGIK